MHLKNLLWILTVLFLFGITTQAALAQETCADHHTLVDGECKQSRFLSDKDGPGELNLYGTGWHNRHDLSQINAPPQAQYQDTLCNANQCSGIPQDGFPGSATSLDGCWNKGQVLPQTSWVCLQSIGTGGNTEPGPTLHTCYNDQQGNIISSGGFQFCCALTGTSNSPHGLEFVGPTHPEFTQCTQTQCTDNDNDGFSSDGGSCGPVDCNDNNRFIHPGMRDSVCNGVDNNCNGQIDENYEDTPTSCGVGACGATGVLTCQDGQEIDTCNPDNPTREVCDSIDNDCDGQNNEGNVCHVPVCGNGIREAGEQCDDGNRRNGDGCSSTCQTQPVECNANSDCSDGLFCNGAEQCVNHVCVAGTAPLVNDGVSCTQDFCDESRDRVVHTPRNNFCNDGLFCNGAETCHASLGCQAGTPPTVNDGVSCTLDSCDETNDQIVHIPNHGVCNDGLFCNGAEVCDATLDCQAGQTVQCNDGLFCNGQETCNEATDSCSSGTAVDCSANNIGSVASCDNVPDDNPSTHDFRESFTSTCNESTDSCSTGDSTIQSTCSQLLCGATCDSNSDCTTGLDGVCTSSCECQYSGPLALDVDLDANPTSGSEPLQVSFTCDAIGGEGPFTYSMDFGGSSSLQVVTTSQTSVSFSHTYTDGSHTARCDVVDNAAQTDSDSLSINADNVVVCGDSLVEGNEQCELGQTETVTCGTSDIGICSFGHQTRACTDSCQWSTFSACQGNTEPGQETCDGFDNDCDGTIDEFYVCGSGGSRDRPNELDEFLQVSRVGVTEEVLQQGDDLIIVVNVRSYERHELTDLKVSVVVPELGIKESSRSFDVDVDNEDTRVMVVEIPSYAHPGQYDARITISNDEIRRVKHRIFWIE